MMMPDDPFFQAAVSPVTQQWGVYDVCEPQGADEVLIGGVLSAGDTIAIDGAAGYYEATIDLGENTGASVLTLMGGDFSSRFQIYHSGILVADSLYVGDVIALSDGFLITEWSGLIPRFKLNDEHDFEQFGFALSASGPADLASTSNVRLEGSHGKQLRVQPGYPSNSAPAFDKRVRLSVFKGVGASRYASLRVSCPVKEAVWSISEITSP